MITEIPEYLSKMNYQDIYPQLVQLTEENRKLPCTAKKKHF